MREFSYFSWYEAIEIDGLVFLRKDALRNCPWVASPGKARENPREISTPHGLETF
jgi:hypothetical protein